MYKPIEVTMFHYSLSYKHIWNHQVLSLVLNVPLPIMPASPWEALHKNKWRNVRARGSGGLVFVRHNRTAVYELSTCDIRWSSTRQITAWRGQVATESHHCLRSYWLLIADGGGRASFPYGCSPSMSNMFQWMATRLKLYRQYIWNSAFCFVCQWRHQVVLVRSGEDDRGKDEILGGQ